jgi:hypothetical protein
MNKPSARKPPGFRFHDLRLMHRAIAVAHKLGNARDRIRFGK